MAFILPLMIFSLASWSVEFDVKKITIDGQVITRETPKIDQIAVEGADNIYNSLNIAPRAYTHFSKPKASFELSAARCMEIAIENHSPSILKDPYTENTQGIYDRVWLMHFEELRPAFKIRLPVISIYDLKDIYVDAQNGDILKIEDAAMFLSAPAEVYSFSPPTSEHSTSNLETVMLRHLNRVEENGFLDGEYIGVRTCCKYFTCPKDGPCNEHTKRCALKSHENAQQYRELLALPTDTLGLDPLIDLPPTIFVDAVRCTNLPFARAGFKEGSPALGFYAEPMDNFSPESEMDKFSEIQVYHSVSSFFDHIRKLLNDPSWCLRKEAMLCNPDGSAKIENGRPVKPYQVFVNQMIPDMKMEGPHMQDPDNFLAQALAGKGSRDNPIKLDSFSRLGNAAFVPALSTLKKNSLRADEILSDLIKPFDHNVFYQGDRDFAYDGDVVFHEFMHAITTTMVGKLNSLGLDQWGINTEPGSLNEAWSDYFAASFTHHPNVGEYASLKDGYGENALRNIDNNARCPDDTIGEIHNDGLIWSGALWQIRSLTEKSFGEPKAFEFDQAVLASLAQAHIDESFKVQSKKLLDTLKERGLPEVLELAEKVFKERGISDCFRVSTLSTVDDKNRLNTRVKNLLFVASKNQLGLKNYAPMTSQLEIAIPAGATSVNLSWRQYLGSAGALLGTEVSPFTTQHAEPLSALYSFDEPIVWKFLKTTAVATMDNEKLEQKPLRATYKDGYWHLNIPVELARCEQSMMYVSIMSNDFKYALENINVSFEQSNKNQGRCHFEGVRRNQIAKNIPNGCTTSLPAEPLMLLALWWLRRRAIKNPR